MTSGPMKGGSGGLESAEGISISASMSPSWCPWNRSTSHFHPRWSTMYLVLSMAKPPQSRRAISSASVTGTGYSHSSRMAPEFRPLTVRKASLPRMRMRTVASGSADM